jgi:hypothetical protein
MKKILKKLFGGLNITWPKLIIFSIIMGIYTALMAMCVPDGNSFHDIAVTPEWWVLPAIIIIVNSKKPLEAALKTFVFFLISQPIVYLIQVPFSQLGWGLFNYYPFWFNITIATFPGAFIGWFIKKDKWYSGLILSVMTVFLAFIGVNYFKTFIENPPNHLLSIIYCFGIIPIFIFTIFKDKIPRIITAIATIITIIVCACLLNTSPFESYQTDFASKQDITLIGEPHVSYWAGDGSISDNPVTIIRYEEDGNIKYTLKLSGLKGKEYEVHIADDENEYNYIYYFDKEQNTVIFKKK